MKIECTIKRDGGSHISIGTELYSFVPEIDGGAHVCEVEDESHAARLLTITESFRAVAQSGDTTSTEKDKQPLATENEAQSSASETPEQERERLMQAYEAKFGKRPHWKTSNKTIMADLAE